jgi:hypothetical protein
MRPPRMTMLRWTIAVALIVLLIYGGIGVVWLRRRHNYYLARAQEYAEQVSTLRSWQQTLLSDSKKADPSHDPWFNQRENEKAQVAGELDYAAEMARKYRRAARYPWLSVEHELPEPW